MVTYAEFREAFIASKDKGDWRMRSMIGGIALNRASHSVDSDLSDLLAALDDVAAGRSLNHPDAVALRSIFDHGSAVA